jgi:CRP-like cAMP-binding protein
MTTVSNQELRRFPVFERYSDDDLARQVTPHLRPEQVGAGEFICHERAPGDCCYFLLDGQVEVRISTASGRPEVIGHLNAGSVFGQIALLDGGHRSATCVAMGPCALLILDRQHFEQLLHSGHRLAYDLLRQIGSSLAAQVRQATESLSAMSESRVEDTSAISERLRSFIRPHDDPQQPGAPRPALRLRTFSL